MTVTLRKQASSGGGVLFLVRHGKTALNGANDDDRIRGWKNIPLDATGREQAAKLGRLFEGVDVDKVYSSDLVRAVDTAKPIAAAVGTTVVEMRTFRPWHLGRFQGASSKEVTAALDEFTHEPDRQVPGGESFNTFLGRYLPALERLLAEVRNGARIVVVAHYRNAKATEAFLDGDGKGDKASDLKLSDFMHDGVQTGSIMAITWSPAQKRFRWRHVSSPKVSLRKEAPRAAGVAVRARDTGRVLMLQRSIADPDDPARGQWEFPGGKLEPGEDPRAGAQREWEEETGVPLPAGETAGSWTHGVYVGHIHVVPREADVHLNADAESRPIGNPDDPDGDDIETLCWLPLSEARAMPALRHEVRVGTDWQALERAVPVPVAKSVSIRPRMAVSLRKRSYPMLVRSHVRGGSTVSSEVQAELRRWLLAHPDVRAREAAEHGFDPCHDLPRYLAAERGEGDHLSLNVSPLTVPAIREWEREEAREPVGKEQPTAGDVHIDSGTWSKRKRRRSDEPDEAESMPDGDELELSVVKADRARQLVYGIVLEPHRVDSQGDWEDHETIEKAAHRYLGQVFQGGSTDLVNLQHRWDAPGVYPVESYVAPADFELGGEPVAKGSWVLVMKVADLATWQEVLDGRWGGFSVEGTGRRNHDLPHPPESAAAGRR